MHFTSPQLPLFRLTNEHDLLLFLIQKELQGARFIHDLTSAGFDTSRYDPDLGVVILSLFGFQERSDEILDWYYTELDTIVTRINLDDKESIKVLTLEFYHTIKTKVCGD